MPAPTKYSNDLRDRAQRMVAESRSEDPVLTPDVAANRIGPRAGVVPDMLRSRVKWAAIDGRQRPGMSAVDEVGVADEFHHRTTSR